MNGRDLLIALTTTMLMLVGLPAWATLEIEESAPQADAYDAHPSLRSLAFVTPEAPGQVILPPALYFLAPPTLIWRAPGSWLYPPPPPPPPPPVAEPGFNRPAAPSQRDLTAYHATRAHAMDQQIYKRNGDTTLWFGTPGLARTYLDGSFWYWPTWLYPPVAPGLAHPSNTDNARYLIERAHRFSKDTYRTP